MRYFDVRQLTDSWQSDILSPLSHGGRMQFQSKRRELIAFLGGTIAAWPLAARAQPAGTVWRIDFLTPRTRPSPPGHDAFSDAFIDGMSKLGYSEGKNLMVEWRYADGVYTRDLQRAGRDGGGQTDIPRRIPAHALPDPRVGYYEGAMA